MKKTTVVVIAMILIAVLGIVFLLTSQSNTYDPPRYLDYDYSYHTETGDTLYAKNVWFNIYEVVGLQYIRLGSTQSLRYDLFTRNPELYDNQLHTWSVTAWDDSLQQESFYSETVSEFLPSPPIQTVTNLRITK